MTPTERTPTHLVFDDVLDAEAFAALQAHLRRETFTDVHSAGGVRRVWTVADGRPLRGPGVIAGFGAAGAWTAADGEDAPDTPLRAVLDTVLGQADTFAGLIGAGGVEWTDVVARAWLYPPGTGLGWHDDSESYAGAFVFFAHPVWQLDWAGELLLLDEASEDAPADPSLAASALLSPMPLPRVGGGRFVTARPNRLVVLRAGVLHRIVPVSPLAGHHVRATVSGFFLRPRADASAS